MYVLYILKRDPLLLKKAISSLIAELWRAKRACGAPCVSKSSHPGKFGNHVTVHRPPAARPSVPQGDQCSIPHFLATIFWQHRKTDIAHIFHINVVINWQLSKQDIRWPVSPDRIAGSGFDPSRSNIFWSYPLTSYKFSNDCRLKFNFINSYEICCALYLPHN